jgi:hypothetical protein
LPPRSSPILIVNYLVPILIVPFSSFTSLGSMNLSITATYIA